MKIELIVHCWRYSRLLCYQLSSLCAYDGKHQLTATVCCAFRDHDPATADMLSYFAIPPTCRLSIHLKLMLKERLLRRAIGRNEAAKESTADLVLFSDCDMVFGPGAIDAIAQQFPKDAVLCFPRIVGKCSHERGDEYIAAVTKPGLYQIDPADFLPARYNRAIGGTQWVPGDVARRGYLPDHRRYQRPAERWQKTNEDQPYRKWIGGGRGIPLEILNVYRIRHTRYGREHDVEN